jgi:DNA-binding transcriptional LysR family regulator
MLDLRLLETFREVATRGSFSAAAEALSFTQPAVSQHVARLEKHVGTRLFERDARGVTVTPAGERMLHHAEALLDAARRAEADVRASGGIDSPVVRVGSFPTAAGGLVPMAFQELRAAQPGLELKLRILEPEAAVDELCRDRLDVALVIDSEVARFTPPKGVEVLQVFVDPMLVALPAGHPLARRASVPLELLRNESWLMPDVGGTCEDSNIVLRACHLAGFAPSVHYESDDYHALQGLAASGMGVALLPSLAAQSVRRDIVVRPVEGQAPSRIILAAAKAERGPAVDSALDALELAGRRLSLGSLSAVAA